MTDTAAAPAREGDPAEAPELPADEPGLLAWANTILRDLADVQAERAANAKAEKVDLHRLMHRYQAIDQSLGTRESWILKELERVAEALPMRGGKKSRLLAFGAIGYRTVPERLDVVDEALLREEAQGWDPDVLALLFRAAPPKLDHRQLSVMVKSGGPVPAGCVLHEKREQFFARAEIKPASAGGAS